MSPYRFIYIIMFFIGLKMEIIYIYLYNIDIMKNYIRHMKFARSPQMLEISLDDKTYSFSVLNSGTELIERPPGKLTKPFGKYQHSHKVYHIVLYCEGETQFLINDELFLGTPGTLAITNPDERHCFSAGLHNGKKPIYKCFSFILEENDGNNALHLPVHELFSLYFGTVFVKKIFPVTLNKRLFNRTAGFIDEITEQLIDNKQMAACSCIINFMNFMGSEFFLPEKETLRKDEIPMLKIKNFIEKNFQKKFNIRDLSKLSGLSGEYIIRSFNRKYMIPPMAYQMELRLKAAQAMLISTDLKIGEIALRTGFNDIYHFSKTFKKYYGDTPRVYRQAVFTT